MSRRRRQLDPRLHNPAWLRSAHIEQRRPVTDIADELGVSRSAVHGQLVKFGIPRQGHSATSSPGGEHQPQAPREPGTADLDLDEVRRLYVDERLSLTEVGRRLGRSETKVRYFLRRHGVERRPPSVKLTRGAWRALDADDLRRRYLDLGQSGPRIAADLGVGVNVVYGALKQAGAQRRSPRSVPRYLIDEGWLKRRYVDEGASMAQVAREAGCSAETIRRRLDAAGIPRRPGSLRRSDRAGST